METCTCVTGATKVSETTCQCISDEYEVDEEGVSCKKKSTGGNTGDNEGGDTGTLKTCGDYTKYKGQQKEDCPCVDNAQGKGVDTMDCECMSGFVGNEDKTVCVKESTEDAEPTPGETGGNDSSISVTLLLTLLLLALI